MFEGKGKTFSEKKWNEDVFYVSPSCVFVIDGATGLSNNQVMSEDDAHWFATSLKEEIIKRMNMDSLMDILKESILSVQNQYKLDVSSMKSQDMPSGCISLFREKDGQIEYLGLGDCVGVIEFNDGSCELLFDDRIEKMDGAVILKMIQLSKELNIPYLQTRPYVNPILLENRNLRNKEDGFYSLDLTIDGLEGSIYKSWKKEDVNRIACLTDGLYQLMDFNESWNETDLLNALENDLDAAFLSLYEDQEKDCECLKNPRLKKRDDTTGIIVKVK